MANPNQTQTSNKKTNTPPPATGNGAKTEAPKATPAPVAEPALPTPTMSAEVGATGAVAATGEPVKPAKKRAKRERVRLVSTSIPGMWVRMFQDVLTKYGAPYDSTGTAMIVKAGTPFGGVRTPGEPGAKAARKAAKVAEQAALAAMSDEQKIEFARAQRDERQKAKVAKDTAERNALIAQIKADVLAGKL